MYDSFWVPETTNIAFWMPLGASWGVLGRLGASWGRFGVSLGGVLGTLLHMGLVLRGAKLAPVEYTTFFAFRVTPPAEQRKVPMEALKRTA